MARGLAPFFLQGLIGQSGVGGVLLDFFGRVKERFRGHARNDLCPVLQGLGVQAQLAERCRLEEEASSGRGGSFGVIDVLEGPICWVGVKNTSGQA